ncbi:hypothetical protein B0H19DRAFT_713859 [Mycena capillaripes]|nr:hypothetical protein B0H19DRAFT_713859 [Mycena capillaripes]
MGPHSKLAVWPALPFAIRASASSSSLTLKAESYGAARVFLQESPNVGWCYITRLVIRMPNEIASADVEDILQILTLLRNVRLCRLDGRYPHVNWKSKLDHRFSTAIPDFLASQPLRELHVNSVSEIPAMVFFRLLRAAPSIFFTCVWVARPEENELSIVPVTTASTIKRLSFTHGCDSAYTLLALPQFAFHSSALQELETAVPFRDVEPVYGHAMISYAAHTLERLKVRIDGQSPPPILPLPFLPELRYLEFKCALQDFIYGVPWFVDTIPIFLASSSCLAELIVTLHVPTTQADLSQEFNSELLVALDDALVVHPGSPSLACHFKWMAGEGTLTLTAFVGLVRQGMPKMFHQGRLSFEQLQDDRLSIFDLPQWAA